MANQLAEVFERYPHWQKDPRQDQEVRKMGCIRLFFILEKPTLRP